MDTEVNPEGETSQESFDDAGESPESIEASETSELEQSTDEETKTYTVKVSGEERSVTLDELQSGYMMDTDYRQKTTALAEQRKAAEAENRERTTRVDQTLAELRELANQFESNINWDELRDTDPSEYLRQQELSRQRRQAITQATQQRQQEQEAEFTQYLNEQTDSLISKLPEWMNVATKEKEQEGIRHSMKSVGFTDEESGRMYDHRLVLLARKAYLYDQLQSKSPATEKVVRKTPTSIKQGGVKTGGIDGQIASLQKEAAETGDMRVAAKLRLLRLEKTKRKK